MLVASAAVTREPGRAVVWTVTLVDDDAMADCCREWLSRWTAALTPIGSADCTRSP